MYPYYWSFSTFILWKIITNWFEKPPGQATVWLTAHLDHLLKSVHVLLHAVMGAQVRHKIAGIHPIQPMEKRVDACMQVDEINLRDVSCQQRLIIQLVNHSKILWGILLQMKSFLKGCLIIFWDFCGRLNHPGFKYMPQGYKYCITESYSLCKLSNSYPSFSGSKKLDGQRYQKIHIDSACRVGESWVIVWWAPELQLSELQHRCRSVTHKWSYVYCRLQEAYLRDLSHYQLTLRHLRSDSSSG